MEFNNKLYDLRKKKGLSQEELANRLNVSRQTVSKWEVGDSTPDMEKLVAISDLFEVSLDELVLDRASEPETAPQPEDSAQVSDETKAVLKEEIEKKARKGIKIAAIILGAVLLVDFASFIIYVAINGLPS